MTVQPFDVAEVMAAAPDVFMARMGITPDGRHPLASVLSVEKIAYATGLKTRGVAGGADHDVMASGFASSDFGKLFADGVKGVAAAAYDTASQDYRRFSGVSLQPDFKSGSIVGFSMDFDLQEVPDATSISHGAKFGFDGGSAVTLKTYGRLAFLARNLIVSDRFDVIQQIFTGVGMSAAQKEARILAATLNSNPNMQDGQPVFSAGNTVELALDESSLGSAMAMLRTQKGDAGNDLNLATRHLVVAPELEYAAHKLIANAGLAQIEVTSLCGLNAGRWFVTTDPALYPAVSLLRLGANRNPLMVSLAKAMNPEGISLKATADLGAAFVRRTGIVRGGI